MHVLLDLVEGRQVDACVASLSGGQTGGCMCCLTKWRAGRWMHVLLDLVEGIQVDARVACFSGGQGGGCMCCLTHRNNNF